MQIAMSRILSRRHPAQILGPVVVWLPIEMSAAIAFWARPVESFADKSVYGLGVALSAIPYINCYIAVRGPLPQGAKFSRLAFPDPSKRTRFVAPAG